MKVQFTSKVTDEEGKAVTKTIDAEATVSNISEFGNASTFLNVFDRYEQAVLKVRNQTAAELTQAYLEVAALEDFEKRGLYQQDKAPL